MFIFLNTETTGTGPEDRLCQIVFKPEGEPAVCELFNPGRPIAIEAMAIHHITNKMVTGATPHDPYRNNLILIPRMPFGKHKGLLCCEVPPDYLEWLLTTGLDKDMEYAVKKDLGRLSEG